MNYSMLTTSLVAVATLSSKETNQDACAVIESKTTPAMGVVVCDGIGSHLGAEFASSFAVESIANQLEEMPSDLVAVLDSRLMTDVYHNACTAIADKSAADAIARAVLVAGAAPGTTALCALELQHSIMLAYCGNGAILHLRSNFNEFPESALLPWSAVNILNPHSQPVRGKNPLYKFLSALASPSEVVPSVVMLSKDQLLMGDIIAVVSDGIWSYDQATIGQNDAGVWIHADTTLPLLYQHLSGFFLHGEFSSTALTRTLESYLNAVKERGLMTDDCTIGVLITGKAIEYQHTRLANHKQETQHEIDQSSVLAEHRA
jgi:serine/threonine protein phosphatase PrpC